MPTLEITRSTPIQRTPRVMQLEGMFDVPPTKQSEVTWKAHLPLEEHPWQVGLIVGPSGCGKSTIARELFADDLVHGFDWPPDKSLVDAFPADMQMKTITQLLSSVGFSSPPSWLRPFGVLSNGEQFRATIARALAEGSQRVVVDEFTSVIDRTVAQVGSAAIAKAVRRTADSDAPRQFVGVACHFDIVDWMDPDWVYEPATDTFHWRLERQRPPITLTIQRVHPAAWQIFKHHHYLDTGLHRAARCFLATMHNQPAAFTAVLSFPSPTNPMWREHRTVCLPDFQGVGIGNAMSRFVASLMVTTGKQYGSTTSNPAMIQHRARSAEWHMQRKPSMVNTISHPSLRASRSGRAASVAKNSSGRLTAGFRYVGPPADAATCRALLPEFDTRPLLDILRRYPSCTKPALLRKTGLQKTWLDRQLRELLAAGTITRRGNGTANSPHTYELAESQTAAS